MDQRPTVFLVTHDLREAAYLATRILIMAARPGRVIEERAVNFARPRTMETTYETDFTDLTQTLRSAIVAAKSINRTIP
jgi:NitT/TauT family transport system ATP-binding protein